ncbi:MAG TPA: hypothetical protein VEW74_03235 [Candidatus Nitrosotalea sp.]|nr:hypothetical protein [Candidatus Nitrosotalea sp.]
MPLQNRVTPFGEVVALSGRGTMMGNRGILHDDSRRIVRGWQVRRWIACVLEFRGRRRLVMQPHRYTELFFLDEAAAFAAGHRPCAECRRADFNRFQSIWRASFGGPANADAMDDRLHAERLDGKRKRTYLAPIAALPDGAYIAADGLAWLVLGDTLHEWSDSGYVRRRARPRRGKAEVLTPRAIVEILAAGYSSESSIHRSASGASGFVRRPLSTKPQRS